MKRTYGFLAFFILFQSGVLKANGLEINEFESWNLIYSPKGIEPIFYPNPVKEILYLKKNTAYLIKNNKGLVVKQGFGSEVNVADLPNGAYTLEIKGKSETFVKQ